MALQYDKQEGVILDEQGRQVAALQPGPDRDSLGRQMAAAPELATQLQALLLVARMFNRRTDASWAALEAQTLDILREAGVRP